mgnify:CR=1 FL=1
MLPSRNFYLSIMFTLLIWAGALLSIPIDPVPLTFQTAVIFLAAFLLPMNYALFSVVLYIVLGVLGLPVFSGGRSGVEVLYGPTGGFIFGFILITFIISRLTRKVRYGAYSAPQFWAAAWPCIVATIILQLCGMLWGKFNTEQPWTIILENWLYPFYINMVVKVIIATVVAVYVWKMFPESKES